MAWVWGAYPLSCQIKKSENMWVLKTCQLFIFQVFQFIRLSSYTKFSYQEWLSEFFQLVADVITEKKLTYISKYLFLKFKKQESCSKNEFHGTLFYQARKPNIWYEGIRYPTKAWYPISVTSPIPDIRYPVEHRAGYPVSCRAPNWISGILSGTKAES